MNNGELIVLFKNGQKLVIDDYSRLSAESFSDIFQKCNAQRYFLFKKDFYYYNHIGGLFVLNMKDVLSFVWREVGQ